MISSLLVNGFIRNAEHPERPEVRLQYGLLTGYVGIAVNLLLFVVKLLAGLISGSIAMAADAVNNLSDSGSSIITVLGFKLSGKPADNEHPFGHGRLEYVAALIVSVIIVGVGLNFFKESVMRIFHPSDVQADNLILLLFGGTLLFKGWLFFFYRKIGLSIKSKAIKAAALDSLSDMLGTTVVLLAVIAGRYTKFPIDGCAGTVVASLVFFAGISVLRETINPLLGECPDSEMVEKLRNCLLQCPGIRGVHDIIIHNYGPNQYFATAHAEVARDGDILAVHNLLEAAEVEVARQMPVRLLLHCDPFETSDTRVITWRGRLENEIAAFDPNFKVYDFLLKEEENHRELCFHLLIPRSYALSPEKIHDRLQADMAKYDPEIRLNIEFLNAYV